MASTDHQGNFLRGADLSQYGRRAAEERTTRTLMMRRMKFPKIKNLGASRMTMSDDVETVTADDVIYALKSLHEGQIGKLADTLVRLAGADERALTEIMKESNVCDAIFGACEAGSIGVKLILVRALQRIIPCIGEAQSALIDTGIVPLAAEMFKLDPRLACESMDLLSVIVRASQWGRDTAVCCGIQDTLVELALNCGDEQVCVRACVTLRSIFETCDSEMVETAVATAEEALELIRTESVPVLHEVLELFCSLSNVNNAVSLFLERGLHMEALKMLEVDALRRPALAFIGNLANGEAVKVKEMIDAGLVRILVAFIESEYTADALLVLSNLVETVPDEMTDVVAPQMVRLIVEIAQVANFDIRRECAFFLATLIWYMDPVVLDPLTNSEVLNELSEMCSSGNTKVIQRCLGAIMRLYHLSRATGRVAEFMAMMEEVDVAERVQELIDDNDPEILRSALALQSVLVGKV